MQDGAIDWQRIRAVSWDLDGTLYDRAPMYLALRRRIVRGLLSRRCLSTLRALGAALHHRRLEPSLRAAGGALRPPPPLWASPEWAIFQRELLVPSVGEVGPRPEVAGLLAAIAASGRRQVVLSDFRGEEKLAALGLRGAFSEVFAGEDEGFIKPAPELFERVLRALQLRPDQLLHLGDRPDTDGAGAAAAGVPCLIVAPSFAPLEALLGGGAG